MLASFGALLPRSLDPSAGLGRADRAALSDTDLDAVSAGNVED